MKSKVKEIGTFELLTPQMYLTDPGYEPGTWCMGTLKNCVIGTWCAAVRIADEGRWGKRIVLLVVWKDGSDDPPMRLLRKGMVRIPVGLQMIDADIGVDSAQCGFFDVSRYQDPTSIDASTIMPDISDWKADDWFKVCCSKTLSEEQAGTIPYGAVSTSGYGDGSYFGGYRVNEESQIDMAFVSFI